MAFNVGAGVLQKMTELGDVAIRDSVFYHPESILSITTEFAWGLTHDYRATNVSGAWVVIAYKLPDAASSAQFIDMRGKLPKRTPNSTYPLRTLSLVNTLCVHYTAAPPERTVQDIATYQTTVQTGDLFPEIAYHLFVENNGLLVWCHDANKRVWGSAQSGMNEKAIHICYSGNTAPNEAQIDGLQRGKIFAQYSMLTGTHLQVVGHKDGYATQCPGATWDTWKSRIS